MSKQAPIVDLHQMGGVNPLPIPPAPVNPAESDYDARHERPTADLTGA